MTKNKAIKIYLLCVINWVIWAVWLQVAVIPIYAQSQAEPSAAGQISPQTMEEYLISALEQADLSVIEAFKVIDCENKKWDAETVYVNTDKSLDIGLFQLNSKWHPYISIMDKFDWKKNIDYAIQLRLKDGSYRQWTCGKNLGL